MKTFDASEAFVLVMSLLLIGLLINIGIGSRAPNQDIQAAAPQPNLPPVATPLSHADTSRRRVAVTYLERNEVGTSWFRPSDDKATTIRDLVPTENDIHWQVRENGDDNRIIDMPMRGTSEFSGYSNRIDRCEWRVTPGQSTTQCKFTFGLVHPDE